MNVIKQLIGRTIFLSGVCFAGITVGRAETPTPSPTQGVTLQDCFQSAKKISESIGISAENTRLLQAQYRSGLGSILPDLRWIKEQFYQDKGGTPGGGSPLQVQPNSYFELKQPIFGGFRDWAGIAIAKSQSEQAKLSERSTELGLLSDVAAAFYSAYTMQDSLAILEETRKLNQEQVDQLSRWVEIGRSRPSEVLSAQTQLATLEAQIVDTKRTYAGSRHLLRFLTGVPENVPLIDDFRSAGTLPLEEALSRSSNRPELLSAEESLKQAELQIRYARGGHWPTLKASGRWYTERVGFLENVDWDATFTLNVPIYQGGSVQADISAARAQQIMSQLSYSRLKRDVERQVRTAHEDLLQATAEVQAYDKAVQLVQKNYDVQKKEYRLGVISNLELLRLLTDMQTVRRQWLESRANARLDDIRLRVSMGESL